MTSKSFLSTCVLVIISTISAFGTTPDRESTLRFPEAVVKSNSYATTVDPAYRHAPEASYQAFRQMKFGVRIHWGLYTMLPRAEESWSFLELNDEERQSYVESYKRWNPQGFDAEKWMDFFDRAGFRCFAITTKHHEGFSLFDTKTRVTQRPNYTAPDGIEIEDCDLAYSVMDTPFKRDIVKELCDAARRHDIKINLYFSHTDWYDADFRPYGTHPLQTISSDKKQLERRQKRPVKPFPEPTPEEVERMLARHRSQLKELLTSYGKIDMLCFDIQLGVTVWPQVKETVQELREIQPEVMFRNRGIGNYGDYHTPERVIPGEGSTNPMPWMVIYPLGSHFSWDADAANYKGAKWVIDNLVDSVAKGGNFMVGIGPNPNGEFHPAAIAQLEEVGDWLKTNGEGIFETRARTGNAWKDGDDIRFTESVDGAVVYAFLLKRPEASVVLRNASVAPGQVIHLLGYEKPLSSKAEGSDLSITFPEDAPNALAYTLKISRRPQ